MFITSMIHVLLESPAVLVFFFAESGQKPASERQVDMLYLIYRRDRTKFNHQNLTCFNRICHGRCHVKEHLVGETLSAQCR
jgi:hypothetical protein